MSVNRAARVADIFTMVVIASVAVALAASIWRLVDILSAPKTLAMPGTAPMPAGDITPALALAPFGKGDGSAVPQTSLALELRGIVLASPRSASTALIAPIGGAPAAYAIGAPVPGGATIADIAATRILLRQNGRLERLDLPHISTAGAAPPPTGISQTPAGPVVAPPPGMPNAALAASPAAMSLLDAIPASPAAGGYRVDAPLSPTAQRSGLQAGDIIEKINGQSPDSVAADRGSVGAIMALGAAQMTVLRAGHRLSLTFILR